MNRIFVFRVLVLLELELLELELQLLEFEHLKDKTSNMNKDKKINGEFTLYR